MGGVCAGEDLPTIVASQWAIATERLLDGLERLPHERWCVTSYDRLVDDAPAEIARVAEFCGFAPITAENGWDTRSQHLTDSPEPRRWHHNAADLEASWPIVAAQAERARDLFADPPRTRPRRPPTTSDLTVVDETEPDDHERGFSSVHTASLPAILAELGITLFVSTYQSGRVIAVRSDGVELNTHFRVFSGPMGIAVDRERLAIGTQRSVIEYRNQPTVAAKLHPLGRHDAAFLPRVNRYTGALQVHEVARVGGELWVVATRFWCLATLDDEHSFVPRWRPPFVSALAAEDRCHLNGMAVVDGRIGFVTVMADTDVADGWRDRKVDGGLVLDVDSGEAVARGLSMPHSPRFHDGTLWVLSSGRGQVCVVDLETGAVEVVATLPGFTRGLAFAGPYAFVGLSQVRESVFGGIPLAEQLDETRTAVWRVGPRHAHGPLGGLPALRGDRPGAVRRPGAARHPVARARRGRIRADLQFLRAARRGPERGAPRPAVTARRR